MKRTKILFLAAIILAVGGAIGYHSYQKNQEPKLSKLAIANIEALTEGESAGGNVGGPNGGFYSTGNSIKLSGTSFDAKEIKMGAEVSIGIYPSYGDALASIKANGILEYKIESFMWAEYDCDKKTKSNCVVCFRYRI